MVNALVDCPAVSPEEIRQLRDRLGLTQQQMAEKLQTTVTTISRWENGARKPRGLYAKALDRLSNRPPAP
jgi:DNA-binding transcriptional regulator YiaG